MLCAHAIEMTRAILTLFVAALCIFLAGPELGIALESLGLLHLLGAELFLLCFAVPAIFYFYRLEKWLHQLDPYFFIPARTQLGEQPGLVAHMIPGYVVSLLWIASLTFVVT